MCVKMTVITLSLLGAQNLVCVLSLLSMLSLLILHASFFVSMISDSVCIFLSFLFFFGCDFFFFSPFHLDVHVTKMYRKPHLSNRDISL